jgi:hypothetical protein
MYGTAFMHWCTSQTCASDGDGESERLLLGRCWVCTDACSSLLTPLLPLLLLPCHFTCYVTAGGDEEAEAAALEVCKEAEITAIVRDSQPAAAPIYLDSTPKSFLK